MHTRGNSRETYHRLGNVRHKEEVRTKRALKARVGDSVKAGDVLSVLEAMKRENEIAARMAGVVEEVIVWEGASASRGGALVLIG